jgi:predicted aldo/keto reductase-like oxidoreductase
MSGGKALYEKTLETRQVRAIAMQVLGGGAISPKEAIEYVCSLPNIESILFGASSKGNIEETMSLIRQFDAQKVK